MCFKIIYFGMITMGTGDAVRPTAFYKMGNTLFFIIKELNKIEYGFELPLHKQR